MRDEKEIVTVANRCFYDSGKKAKCVFSSQESGHVWLRLKADS